MDGGITGVQNSDFHLGHRKSSFPTLAMVCLHRSRPVGTLWIEPSSSKSQHLRDGGTVRL